MDAQDFRSLQEAYLDVYENEQLDELSVNKMHDYINKAEKDRARLNKKWDQGTATSKERKKVFDREEGEARASKKIRQKTGKDSFRLNALDKLKSAITKESYDIFDAILEHLIAEGYADTNESALVIMANMSEEWRQSIVEVKLDEGAAGDVAARAEKLAAQRKGQTPERKQMYASLAYKASERERGPRNTDWQRQGLTQKQRNSRREIDVEYSDETGLKNSTDGPGTITKNKRKLAQQKARGQHAEQYMDEAQVANRDPDRYEAGQQKKSAPVRGEKTPMPPRGDKRREDFEKWYAANVR